MRGIRSALAPTRSKNQIARGMTPVWRLAAWVEHGMHMGARKVVIEYAYKTAGKSGIMCPPPSGSALMSANGLQLSGSGYRYVRRSESGIC
jgi:hypothetical protein